MKLEHFLIGLALFSLVMVSGTFIFAGMIDSYDLDVTTDDIGFNNTYDVADELYDNFGNIKNETLFADVEGGDESADSLIKGGYKAIKNSPKAVSLVGAIFEDISNELNIPQFFVTFAVLILGLSIIFAIIYFIFRYKS